MAGKNSRMDSLPSAGSSIVPQAVEQWELDSMSDSDSSDADSSGNDDGSVRSHEDAELPHQGEKPMPLGYNYHCPRCHERITP